jgi:hypothetical protein
MLECGSRQRRRIISRRLATEITLSFARGASCPKKRTRSRAVLTKPPAGAMALVR